MREQSGGGGDLTIGAGLHEGNGAPNAAAQCTPTYTLSAPERENTECGLTNMNIAGNIHVGASSSDVYLSANAPGCTSAGGGLLVLRPVTKCTIPRSADYRQEHPQMYSVYLPELRDSKGSILTHEYLQLFLESFGDAAPSGIPGLFVRVQNSGHIGKRQHPALHALQSNYGVLPAQEPLL